MNQEMRTAHSLVKRLWPVEWYENLTFYLKTQYKVHKNIDYKILMLKL